MPRVAPVAQMQHADCGAACLAMVLGLHGRRVPLDELREATGTSRDGVNARALVEAARSYGLSAHGVAAGVDDLAALPPGAVLHWEGRHFVVLERVAKGRAHIVDPQRGRRSVPLDAARQAFSGVAIVCQPAPGVEASATVRSGDGRRLVWRHARPLFGPTLWAAVAASAAIRVAAMALPLLTGVIVDRVMPGQDHHLLAVVAAGLAAMVAFDFLANWGRARLLLRLRTAVDVSLTTGLVDHLVRLPYAFFQHRSSGDVLLRLQSGAEVRELLTTGALAALLDGGLAALYLIVLVVMSPPLAGIALGFTLAQVLVVAATWRRQHELTAESLEAEARAASFAFELLAGIETLKASGAERRAAGRWSSLFGREVDAAVARGRLDAVVESLLGALQLGAPMAVLCYGAAEVLDGGMTLGMMLTAAALAGGLMGPLLSLMETTLELSRLRSYLDRIDDVLATPAEQEGEKVVPAAVLTGHLQVEAVSFRYSPGSPPILEDVSTEIPAGGRLGVVGPSGAGKSTLARLLVGLSPPTSGRILYDGADLATLEAGSVRRQLGIVTQRTHLFAATVRDNIAFGDAGLGLEQVREAARRAGLDEDIARMPLGYETIVGEGGSSLSGGQQQRLALARALVHRPRLLLLDEATSDLDTLTERKVLANLRALGCTTVLIAHRLSTVADADLIVVLDQGRVVEQGTPAQLLAGGGLYRRLVDAQHA